MGKDRNEAKREEMRAKVVSPEQLKRDRLETIEQLDFQIESNVKEIEFREMQLKNGIVEKHENYADGLKPKWLLEQNIKWQKVQLKRMKEQKEEILKLLQNDRTQSS